MGVIVRVVVIVLLFASIAAIVTLEASLALLVLGSLLLGIGVIFIALSNPPGVLYLAVLVGFLSTVAMLQITDLRFSTTVSLLLTIAWVGFLVVLWNAARNRMIGVDAGTALLIMQTNGVDVVRNDAVDCDRESPPLEAGARGGSVTARPSDRILRPQRRRFPMIWTWTPYTQADPRTSLLPLYNLTCDVTVKDINTQKMQNLEKITVRVHYRVTDPSKTLKCLPNRQSLMEEVAQELKLDLRRGATQNLVYWETLLCKQVSLTTEDLLRDFFYRRLQRPAFIEPPQSSSPSTPVTGDTEGGATLTNIAPPRTLNHPVEKILQRLLDDAAGELAPDKPKSGGFGDPPPVDADMPATSRQKLAQYFCDFLNAQTGDWGVEILGVAFESVVLTEGQMRVAKAATTRVSDKIRVRHEAELEQIKALYTALSHLYKGTADARVRGTLLAHLFKSLKEHNVELTDTELRHIVHHVVRELGEPNVAIDLSGDLGVSGSQSGG